MKLSRKHKLYGAVLGLGLAAIAIDRLFILEDEAAAVPPVPEPVAVAHPVAVIDPGPAPVPATVLPAKRVTIADRLDRVAESHGLDLANVPDAFEPSPAWFVREPDEVQPEPREIRGERFLEDHTLTAVMASGKHGYVIIDNRTLFIGQELDGFTLVSVGERSAVLESENETVELTLPVR